MSIEEMLNEIAIINKKYETIYKSTGEYFDVFSITNTSTKEVAICRVLCELIDPKGSHCQGDLYLRAFVKSVLGLEFSDDDYKNVNVHREYLINNNRRIDLVIEVKDRCFVPIEVKIYADDLYNQCYDYLMKTVNAKLYYLTLDGRSPAKDTAGDLKKCEDKNEDNPNYEGVSCISFASDIISWLEECLQMPETIKLAPVREVLQQFIRTLKMVTNQLGDEQGMETKNVITKSSETMKLAAEVPIAMKLAAMEKLEEVFNALAKKIEGKNAFIALKSSTSLKEQIATDYNGPRCWPSINYFCQELSDEADIILRIEADDNLKFGFCVYKDGHMLKSCDFEAEGKEIFGDGARFWNNGWMFVNALPVPKGDGPRFRNYNDAYYNLYDKENFEKFIEESYATMKAIIDENKFLASRGFKLL